MRVWVAVSYVLLSLAGLGGLLIGDYPLAVDFPNHAARLFIECNINDPALSRMYVVEYSLIPNLAIDLLHQPLCGAVDPMTFLRGTLVLTMAGILLVVWKLHTFLNDRPNGFVLLAPAMTFNLVTSMGYLNYLIGTFLFLLFAWVMLRYDVLRRHPVLAIALPNIFGGIIFLCHIFALALTGVFLFGLRLAGNSDRPFFKHALRVGLLTAFSFAVPFVMILFAERSGVGFIYALAWKVRLLWAPMLYIDPILAAVIAAAWIVLLYAAFREKVVTIARAVRRPLALLIVFSFLLPSALLNAVDLDSRCFVSVLYLAISALDTGRVERQSPSRTKHAEIAVAVVSTATIVSQLFILGSRIGTYERQVAEYRTASEVIPSLASVLTITDPAPNSAVPRLFYAHLGSYATVDRKSFNPFEFTGRGMQPLAATPNFSCIDVPAGMPLGLGVAQALLNPPTVLKKDDRSAPLRRWDRSFDYVLHYHFGAKGDPFPALLQPIHRGSFFTIYRTSKLPTPNGPCLAAKEQ